MIYKYFRTLVIFKAKGRGEVGKQEEETGNVKNIWWRGRWVVCKGGFT